MPDLHRRVLRSLAAHAVLCALVSAVGGAQQLQDLSVGARVRVHHLGSIASVTGTLAAPARDTIRIAHGGRDTLGLALAAVNRVYVSQGLGKRHVGRNALRGFVIGAVIGGLIGASAALTDPVDAEFFGGFAGTTGFFAALGAAPGLVIGAATGLVRREVWVRVQLQ